MQYRPAITIRLETSLSDPRVIPNVTKVEFFKKFITIESYTSTHVEMDVVPRDRDIEISRVE